MTNMRNGLVRFSGESEEYVGIAREISVTQNGPSFTVAVLIPKTDYSSAVFKSNLQNALLVLFVIFFAAVCCFYFSRRFLSPLLKGLEQIRADKAERTYSDIPEIDDLLDFLSQKDQETEATISELEQEMRHSKYKLDQLQAAHEAVQREYRGRAGGGVPPGIRQKKRGGSRGISAFFGLPEHLNAQGNGDF